MNGFTSNRIEIEDLLVETKKILSDPNFNINDNFFFKEIRKKDDPDHPKNRETLLALGYDLNDVLNEIQSLVIQNYYETVPDSKLNGSFLYVFIKIIQNKQVYIKYKIKVVNNKKIVCLSFHFEKPELDLNKLPYRC